MQASIVICYVQLLCVSWASAELQLPMEEIVIYMPQFLYPCIVNNSHFRHC